MAGEKHRSSWRSTSMLPLMQDGKFFTGELTNELWDTGEQANEQSALPG